MLSFPLGKYLALGWQDPMRGAGLTFKEIDKVVILFHVSTSSVGKAPFLTPLLTVGIVSLLNVIHCYRYAALYRSDFNVHFSND